MRRAGPPYRAGSLGRDLSEQRHPLLNQVAFIRAAGQPGQPRSMNWVGGIPVRRDHINSIRRAGPVDRGEGN